MAFTRLDRKVGLLKAGVAPITIARELNLSRGVICDVIAGRNLSSPSAWRVMNRVAEILGVPVLEVFPGAGSKPRKAA